MKPEQPRGGPLFSLLTCQGIYCWMYPYQRTPMGNPYLSPRVFTGYNPQESLENTINTMGRLLGVHPIVP